MMANNSEDFMHFLSVSETARRIGARPKDISDLLYQRRLDDMRCPIVAGRRLIPEDYLAIVQATLQRVGRLPADRKEAGGAR